MTTLTGRGPLGQKGEKPPKPARKHMRKVSAKRAAHRASDAGQAGSAYMDKAATLPCVQCGATHRKRDLHHCKDKPDHGQDGPYQKSPHKHRRSGDFDVIPLCEHDCHNGGPDSYHKNPTAWRAKHGPDYGYILPTRAAVKAMGGTIDF